MRSTTRKTHDRPTLNAVVDVRAARGEDVGTISRLIRELAEYEHLADQARGTEELLAAGLFGQHPVAEALIAEREAASVGFALYYPTFSTFECRPGLWLEDLYVVPEHRRAGVGRALLSRLAQLALEREWTRVEWAALDWNAPALSFYEGLGAQLLGDWRMLRLHGDALAEVAELTGRGRERGPVR